MTVKDVIAALSRLPQTALVAVCRTGGGVRLINTVIDTPGYYGGECANRLPAAEVAAAEKSLTGDAPQIVMLTLITPNDKVEFQEGSEAE